MAASTSVITGGFLPSRSVPSRPSQSRCAFSYRSSWVVRCHHFESDTSGERINDGSAQSAGTSGRVAGRRELILQTSGAAMLAAIFNFSSLKIHNKAAKGSIYNVLLVLSGERPNYLGVQKNPAALALCPPTPTCISTSEEFNDPAHYVPPWSYNPEDGRGRKKPVSKEQAMQELTEAILSTKPDNFTPRIVKKTDDYIYVEYESAVLGLVHDVEFWFPPGARSLCEYRSASRLGPIDFDVNRKRIKALRQSLEKRGWQSVGY